MQTPPSYSALKHEGMPLYKLARKQLSTQDELEAIVARKSRLVTIHSIELVDFNFPYFTIRAHVSHGTYIRSLIDDIASRAGSCATTHELERIVIGSMRVDRAHLVTDIADIEQLRACMLPDNLDLDKRF